jgi:hypothetical protein
MLDAIASQGALPLSRRRIRSTIILDHRCTQAPRAARVDRLDQDMTIAAGVRQAGAASPRHHFCGSSSGSCRLTNWPVYFVCGALDQTTQEASCELTP